MKILIVAPIFPPDSNVGALRMESLCTFLRKKEHEIILLTNKKLKPIPKTLVSLCYEVEINESKKITGYRLFNKYKKAYDDLFTSVLSAEYIDVIIISGGPFYTFQMSKKAKDKAVPCILDFRDPWVFDFRGLSDILSVKRLVTRIAFAPMERGSIKNATAVVTVTSGWVHQFKLLYPSFKEKFYLIENGYDDEKLRTLCISKKCETHSNIIKIGVFGKLFYYSKYYSMLFLRSIKEVQDNNGKHFFIQQIGDREPEADRYISKIGLAGDFLLSSGFVSYEKGIQDLVDCDVFLMIDSRKHALGTKIYDYIYLEKPILFIGSKKSSFSSLIQKYGNGYVCETKREIINALLSICHRNNHAINNRNSNVKNYSRSKSNKRWEKLLYKVINKKI